jgi:hypothetical protein
MRKTILTIFFGLVQVTLTLGQNISIDTSKSTTKNFEILSKGVNIGYRAGIDSKNNELLVGYYFNIVDIKRHKLITFDNNLWTNFNRIGINSTISYSNDLFSLSYSTDFFQDKKQLRVIPALGLGFGYNDLFSLGFFYNQKFNSETDYPTFAFKLIVRPSFINIVTQNPDGTKW